MPITTSAQKALRQNARRRKANSGRNESYKKSIKEYKKLVSADKTDEAAKALGNVYKKLDKAAKAGSIKKNKASRLKSRLSKLLKK